MSDTNNVKKKSKTPVIIISVLAVAIVAAVVCIIFIFMNNKQKNPLPPVDSNVIMSGDSNPVKVEEGAGSVSMNYKLNATLTLSTETIAMQFENPGDSSHDAVLDLYVISGDQEYLIASSDRIPSGGTLTTMKLAEKGLLTEGRYEAKYTVKYYDASTGEKALLDSNIEGVNLYVIK